MATLTGNSISSTYTSLLKVGDNGTLAASLQAITDGAGNASGLSMNTGGDLTAIGTVTANAFSGPLTGNVTGNLTGNVTGNVTGNLTGNVTGNVTGDVTGNADTATALETARTIAGVSFDGTANISLTTDNITEGSNEYYTAEKVDDQANTLIQAGTGITKTYDDNAGTLTIANSAPDQTVSLSAGSGISTSGTYPSFTITNTQPDQTVSLTAGTGITVTGTYPSFTIANSGAGISLTDLSANDTGGLGSFSYDNTTGVFTYTGPSDANVRALISAVDNGGDGSLSYNSSTGVISYTGPSSSEVQAHITKTYVDSLGIAASTADTLSTPRTINGVTFDGSANISFDTDSVSEGSSNLYYTTARFDTAFGTKSTTNLSEGTNLYYTAERVDDRVANLIVAGTSISSTYDDVNNTLTIANTAPDQTVALTAGTGITTSGTYPNFTVTNSAPDQTVSLTGGANVTVTGTYPSFTIAAASDTDTTYTLSSETSGANAIIRLTGSDASTDDVTLAAGSNITITETGDTITLSSESTDQVRVACKNTSGSTITKGTPVYVTGSVGASAVVTVAPANAASASNMPASGLLLTDLANNGEGHIVTGGVLKNLITDPIDGVTPSENDTIYVKSGGGLTTTKPTGTALIQNVGKVGRVSTTADGSILVSSILRSNDIPNIQQNYFWLGNSSGVPTATEHTLSTLTDANVTSPAAGNILIYDATNSYFENALLTAGTGVSIANADGGITITNSSPDQTVSLTGGTGISTSGTYPNFTITNDSPDQTVALTAGTGIGVSGTYPNFTISNTAVGDNAFGNIAVSGQSTIAADSTNDTLNIAAGSNVTLTTDAGTDTLTIAATAGANTIAIDTYTGNGSTAAYTLSNSASSENELSVYFDGVYQLHDSYTVSGTTLTFDTNVPNGTAIEVQHLVSVNLSNVVQSLTGGDGITASASTGDVTLSLSSTTPNAFTMGGDGSTGGVTVDDGSIQIRSNTGNVAEMRMYCEVSNAHYQTLKAAPHSAASSAVLVLPTASGDLVGTGDTGSVATAMVADNNITHDKLENRYTALSALGTGSTFALDFSAASTFTATANAAATFTFSNAAQGQVIDLILTGNYAITFSETGSTFNKVGSTDYDGTANNLIQIVCTDDSSGAKIYHYSIGTYVSDPTP
jgi:hypothetical protein